MIFRKWIAALLSLAILCTALAIVLQTATGESGTCPQSCQCYQGGPCTCPAGTCGNTMCMNSAGYSGSPAGSYGYFPTAFPKYPGTGPGYPMPINQTPVNRTRPSPYPGPITQPGPYPTMFPQPTITPGMPMPTMYPRPTLGPGMPTQFPGMPFPGRATPTPVPTETPSVTPMPTPIGMPP
jgi:hypothetical protein